MSKIIEKNIGVKKITNDIKTEEIDAPAIIPDQFYIGVDENGEKAVISIQPLAKFINRPRLVINVTNDLTNNTVVPGQIITYTVKISSTSTEPIDRVLLVVDTTIPGNFIDLEPTCLSEERTETIKRLACIVGTVEPAPNNKTIIVKFQVNDDAANGNYVTIFRTLAPRFGSASVIQNIRVENRPLINYTVTKRVEPTTVARGNFTNFFIEVTNKSPFAVSGIKLTDITNLPGEFFQLPPEFHPIPGGFELDVPTLEPNQTDHISVNFRVANDATFGTYKNTATAFAVGGPVVSTDVNVSVAEQQSTRLQVSKTAKPTSSSAGNEVQYLITIRNNGTAIAKNVRLNDFNALPGQFTLVPPDFVVDNNTFTASIGDIGINGVKEYTVFYKSGDNVADGTYGNILTVLLDNGEQSQYIASAEVTITAEPKFEVTKEADRTQVVAGELVTYTFTITNTGPVDLHNLRVTDITNLPGVFDDLPEGFEPTANGFRALIENLPRESGINFPAKFRIDISAPAGTYQNNITVLDPQYLIESGATVNLTILEPSNDIDITKIASVSREFVTYLIDIKNNKDTPIDNVQIIDTSSFQAPFSKIPNNFFILENGFTGSINLAGGETISLIAQQRIPLGTPTSTYVNDVRAIFDGKIQLGSATFRIGGIGPIPPIVVFKSTDRTDNTYHAGEIITYTITVINQTLNNTYRDIVLDDFSDVPGYFIITPCGNGNCSPRFRCEIGDLEPQQTYVAVAQYYVSAGQIGNYNNIITATSPNSPRAVSNVNIVINEKEGLNIFETIEVDRERRLIHYTIDIHDKSATPGKRRVRITQHSTYPSNFVKIPNGFKSNGNDFVGEIEIEQNEVIVLSADQELFVGVPGTDFVSITSATDNNETVVIDKHFSTIPLIA